MTRPNRQAVLIPGIMGSSLRGADGPLWSENFVHNYQRLMAQAGLLKWRGAPAEASLIDEVQLFHYLPIKLPLWTPVMEALSDRGIEPKPFGYDWRDSLANTSARFVAWLSQSLRPPFDLVTHSMGGLLVRVAVGLGQLPVDHIRTLIHVGSPLKGAPSTFAALCGEPSLPLLREALRYRFLWHAGDYARILHNALLTFPAVYELLPTEGKCATLDEVNWFDPIRGGVLDGARCQAASSVQQVLQVAESKLLKHGGVFSIYTTKKYAKDTPLGYKVEVILDGQGPRYVVKRVALSTELGDGTVPAVHAVLPSVQRHEVIDLSHSFLCASRYVARLVVQILSERPG